jgi:uncharacterized protein YgbK (DUF1537 family)
MKPLIGIVADDLTGASDTAVQFVRAGWETELQIRPGRSVARVIAVTTDSRDENARDAAEAVAAAVKRLREAGITHLYKKIDSTLRGQVGAELHATLESWRAPAIAIVCPAFPALGRTVVDGELQVNGTPVAKNSSAAYAVTPVTESHIPTMLGASHIARAAGESAQSLADRIKSSGRIVVVDARSEDDLRRLAAAVTLVGANAIAIGSAGLARHLANAWRANQQAPPAVVIVTSQQDVARRQAAAVAAAGGDRYEPALDDLADDAAWARSSAKVLDRLGRISSTLILVAPADRRHGWPATLIPRRFGELTARIVTRAPRGSIAGVVVTGGDGARGLVDALDATGIDLRDEVMTGVPIGTLIGGPANGLAVVTKAGGFGDEDALVEAVQSVRYRRFA